MEDAKNQLKARDVVIEQLQLNLDKLKRSQFGQSSEKVQRQIDQLELALEDLRTDRAAEQAEADSDADDQAEDGNKKGKKKRGRKKLPAHLPRERSVLDPGSISEFELGVLRARMYEAARAKAERGELRISVPFGYVWHRDYGLGFDPDIRLQETIRLIFARFREIGSARQVLISMTDDGVHFPRPSDGKRMVSFDWVPIRYRNVISILKNPFYAGAVRPELSEPEHTSTLTA